jgi:Tfp pilus assembly protein PilV
MKTKKSELGVGLVEVLVALILLAIGVLGYTALQLRAVDASNEALTKSQATVLLRGLLKVCGPIEMDKELSCCCSIICRHDRSKF